MTIFKTLFIYYFYDTIFDPGSLVIDESNQLKLTEHVLLIYAPSKHQCSILCEICTQK